MYMLLDKFFFVYTCTCKNLQVELAAGEVAPPILVGACPTAVLLWQHVQYVTVSIHTR